MWKNWFLGFVGLWLVGLGFSGFPTQTIKVLVIISGLAVAFISFKNISRHKVAESVKHLSSNKVQDESEELEAKEPKERKISEL